jgi:hypothetical protein
VHPLKIIWWGWGEKGGEIKETIINKMSCYNNLAVDFKVGVFYYYGMKAPFFDHDLRYLAPCHWYRRSNESSWLKISRKSASVYLRANHTLPADVVMNTAMENSNLDIAGDYYIDSKIHSAIDRFRQSLPIDPEGRLKNGEYMLPDGRRMLLTADVHFDW